MAEPLRVPPDFLELLDDLAPDVRRRFVDTWTSVGGSQFVDSPGTGRYHTYLCDELVPWVDERYRTLATPRIAASRRSRPAGTARA